MLGASEMTQQVKVLPTKPEDVNLISGLDMVEGETQFLKVVLWPPYM